MDNVIQNILEAATAEFAQYGLGGARLERIIANTHTSKRMVYYHFGSKEALYQAVLEHANQTVRFRDDTFDPNAGTALEALAKFTENAFDSLSERPDFVRLITFENLGGAPHVKGSRLISKLNQRAIAYMTVIIERGQKDGSIRTGITPLDTYLTLVGLCYYHVANRVGYVAGGLLKTKESEAFAIERKRTIIEVVTRFAMAM